MREILNVRCSQTEMPAVVEVNVDTVYVREGIVRIDEEGFRGWQYNEKQYDKNEYIELLVKDEQVTSLETQLTQTNTDLQGFMDYYFANGGV